MDEPELDLQAWVADGSLRLSLAGALVARTTARLRTWMEGHVPATADLLVLDLAGLDEVDAVGLGALLAAHRRLAPGGHVQLDGARPAVARTLRNAGLLALPQQQHQQQQEASWTTTAALHERRVRPAGRVRSPRMDVARSGRSPAAG